MMAYHDEMVRIRDVNGVEETVYRYLRKCLHCVGWTGGRSNRAARCLRLNKPTSRDMTSCAEFVATEEGLGQIWIETEARIGDEFCRITYKGKTYFVERDGLVALIGWNPDKVNG